MVDGGGMAEKAFLIFILVLKRVNALTYDIPPGMEASPLDCPVWHTGATIPKR